MTKRNPAKKAKAVKAWALVWKDDGHLAQSVVNWPIFGIWPTRAALLREWGKPNLTKIVRVTITIEKERR